MGRRAQIKSFITGCLLLASLALFAAGPAGASRRIVTPSKISIESGELRFAGHVITPSYPSCEEDRKVVLYKAVRNGPAEPIARTRTDNKGAWSVKVSGFAGISLTPFFATVKPSSQGAAGTIYVCAGARSKTIKPSP